MKYDFHAHSTVSDGALTPSALLERVHAQNIQVFALTDHDDIGGWSEAHAAAKRLGIHLVSGVEVSTTWHGKTIHILGYGFNPNDEKFTQRLAKMRNTRIERAVRIDKALENLGFKDTLNGAQKVAGRKSPISRTHFARYMVRVGYAKSFAEVMNKYLADGQPAAVAHEWASIPTAVQWIHEAGGKAFIAHPLRYKLPNSLDLEDLLTYFREAGGDGLEVVYSNHSHRQIERLSELAMHYGLAASGGSDFQTDEDIGGVELGNIPSIPKKNISLLRLLGIE